MRALQTRSTWARIVGILMAVLLLAACGTQASAPQETLLVPQNPPGEDGSNGEPLRTLTVTGTGQVNLIPDLAYLTLAVETHHARLDQAVAENNQRAAQIMQVLQQHGVAEEDIHTSRFAVQQEQHYDDEGNLILGPYTVTNRLVVTVRDLDQLGTLLNAALDAGANRVDGLRFGSSQAQEAQLQAKVAAVQDARHQAEVIAQAAGVSLVAVQTITFGSISSPSKMAYAPDMLAAAPAEVPVSPGELTVKATVTMIFLIR